MATISEKDTPEYMSRKYYRDVRRRNIARLLLTYFVPLLILIVYFNFQYDALMAEGRRLHLKSIAESQANTFDLFLTERLVNLANLIDDPKFHVPPEPEMLTAYLEKLKRNSEAFIDIGYFDSTGIQTNYAGPFPALEERNYGSEEWFRRLKDEKEEFIITDIYLGFRQKPHFTIAVSRIISEQFVVLRATLDPEKIYEYITSLEGANEVYVSIVNSEGYYQVVTPHIGTSLEASSIIPPRENRIGVEEISIKGNSITYAYAWLKTAGWALITQWSEGTGEGLISGFKLQMFLISLIVMLGLLVIIIFRTRKLVQMQIESDRAKAQLEHAAKLASVGELAAGIAHEINNPLAIISEEAGLMKDMMDPQFNLQPKLEEMTPHLDAIHEAVFRCRDITRKLLSFVRRTDVDLKPHDINKVIDSVVDGFLGREMAVSNIVISKNYDTSLPTVVTDSNQLQQVLVNILNNAVDAITGPGKITIATAQQDNLVRIAIADTGKGMTPEQVDKIFLPFYTTKQVGKGTGLGLSVSYGIIKSLGGKIMVESAPGKGSTFTVVLPFRH